MDTTLNAILQNSTLRDELAVFEPCFLFDSDLFKQNVKSFQEAFRHYFGEKFKLSYSTKTNPSMAVLKTLCTIPDAMIEIVSPNELHLAMASGFSLDRIVYNGVIPDATGKFSVASNGGIVNAENYGELKTLADMAKERKIRIEVGLRVNISIDENRAWESRFGVKPYTPQFYQCLELQNEYFEIVGLHSHIHGCRTINFWKKRASILGMLGRALGVKYIDFGSNMFGFMDTRLAEQFDCEIPTAKSYAWNICNELKLCYGREELPNIIIEPGTPVVANTVSVIGRVETINERGFDTIATASCSVYDFGFFHGSPKHPPMDVIHMSKGKHYEDVEIFGYACTEDDTVYKSYTGELAVGDFLLFRNLGAYANSLSSNFIKPAMKTYDIAKLK